MAPIAPPQRLASRSAIVGEDTPIARALPHRARRTTLAIEGEIVHRDSLGNEQVIRPGQVNLMTAGRGIAHTEDSLRDGQRLHAAQR